MRTPPPSGFHNNLLSKMSSPDIGRLLPFLDFIELPQNFVLSRPGMLSDFTYFPETGIGSVVVRALTGESSEVGLFGREGLAPTSGISAAASVPYEVFMQMGGAGYVIANTHLQGAIMQSDSLRLLISRYLHFVSVQTAYTAYSNAVDRIEKRLARWLVMCHDRTEGDDIAFTHQFAGLMLAVRRQSVTDALHVLEGNHLIASSRKYITIRDRKKLQEFAGEAYGVAEREYAANIGVLLAKG